MLRTVFLVLTLAAVATPLPGDPAGNEFTAPSAIDREFFLFFFGFEAGSTGS